MTLSVKISGHNVLVDNEELLGKFNWGVRYHNGHLYLERSYSSEKHKVKRVFFHRELLTCPEGKFVDHINGNGLDNRRSNLRICTHAENMRNRKRHKNNKSGYKGVYLENREGRSPRWVAQIVSHKKKYTLGRFDTPKEAAAMYNAYAKILHKEFASLSV